MSSGAKWWTRVTAAVTGAILTVLVPAHAWAVSNGALAVATEAARGRRGGLGLFGGLAALCCLVVVGAIVLSVVLIMRRRRR